MDNNNEPNRDSQLLYLTFNIEKTPNEGEDADPILVPSANRFFIGVCDGMGGSGSTYYESHGKSKTGAYLASRLVLQTCQDFFQELFKEDQTSNEGYIVKLKPYIKEQLKQKFKSLEFETSGLKSKLIRTLPTTFAGCYIECQGERNKVISLWAGDSRTYVLTANDGLSQISIDDLKEDLDPYENLLKDSQLKNFISADNDFTINQYKIEINTPFLAITATDGCFGYFSTPMQFEYIVLKSLGDANNMQEWKDLLVENIREVAGDDFSMCILVVGWKSFEEVKQNIKQREISIFQESISQLEQLDKLYMELRNQKSRIEEEIKMKEKYRYDVQKIIWNEYRKKYYSIQNNSE